MKTIHQEFHYDRAPEELFALISSGAFQLEIISHLGGKDATLMEHTVSPEGAVTVRTRQRTGVEPPGFAKRLIPAITTVTNTYVWHQLAGMVPVEGRGSPKLRALRFRWEADRAASGRIGIRARFQTGR